MSGASSAAPREQVVTWEATGWDDPRVAALRAAMDAEVRPRYSRPDGAPPVVPPGPTPQEVLVCWLALVDGSPAATASLRRLEVAGEPARFEVKRVFVDAGHRRRGLALSALRRVEGAARARGVERLFLQTGNRQPEAMALYARDGWVPVPTYPPYGVLVHSRCYAKDL